jgi:hypothetical protein
LECFRLEARQLFKFEAPSQAGLYGSRNSAASDHLEQLLGSILRISAASRRSTILGFFAGVLLLGGVFIRLRLGEFESGGE